MNELMFREDGMPHPLVLALIAIVLTMLCFGCGM